MRTHAGLHAFPEVVSESFTVKSWVGRSGGLRPTDRASDRAFPSKIEPHFQIFALRTERSRSFRHQDTSFNRIALVLLSVDEDVSSRLCGLSLAPQAAFFRQRIPPVLSGISAFRDQILTRNGRFRAVFAFLRRSSSDRPSDSVGILGPKTWVGFLH